MINKFDSLSGVEKTLIALILFGISIYIHYVGIENIRLQGQLLFGLGILVQCLFLLIDNFRGSLKKLITAVGIGLFGFMPGKNEKHYTFGGHLFASYVFFIFIFTGYFSKKVLTKISETNLFMFLLVSLYVYLYNYSSFNVFFKVVLGIALIVSTIGVAYSIITRANNEKVRSLLYSIYAFFVLFLCFFQISGSNFSLFFKDTTPQSLNYLETFTGGMLLCYAGMYIAYFIRLIPIRTKYETPGEFKDRVTEYKKNLISSFTNTQITYIDIGIITLILITILGINHYFTHYSDGIIISIFFTISALISYYENKNSDKVVPN